jgi:hypothetical protein
LSAETAVDDLTHTAALTLTWQATQRVPVPVQVYAAALTPGQTLAQADGPLGTALLPNYLWPAGAVVREQRQFVLSGEVERDGFGFQVGLYDPNTLARVPRADNEANTVDIAP